MVQLMPLHLKTPSSLVSFKSRLVLPFWCRLIQNVLEKRPLNQMEFTKKTQITKNTAVRCKQVHMVQLMPLHPKTPSSLVSFKSRLVLPFWCRLIQNVLEKRPLNQMEFTKKTQITKNTAARKKFNENQ